MVNREAAPLVLGISIPVIMLALLVVQMYKFDFLTLIKSVDTIYYITVFPIILGVIMAFLNRAK